VKFIGTKIADNPDIVILLNICIVRYTVNLSIIICYSSANEKVARKHTIQSKKKLAEYKNDTDLRNSTKSREK